MSTGGRRPDLRFPRGEGATTAQVQAGMEREHMKGASRGVRAAQKCPVSPAANISHKMSFPLKVTRSIDL